MNRMNANWRKALIVGAVLVATHAATACFYAHRYASGIIRTPSRPMTLDLTPAEWAKAAYDADSSAYLEVAQNVVAGKGFIWHAPGSPPGRTEQFIFWGPGTPAVVAWWQRLVGGRTMLAFFVFAALAQFVAGALAVATAVQWTRGTLALSLVAFGSGCCPPLQEWFYGVHLTSSEIVALPIMALVFFVLSKALAGWGAGKIDDETRVPLATGGCVPLAMPVRPSKFLLRSKNTGIASDTRGNRTDPPRKWPLAVMWQRLWPSGLSREVWLLFALVGVLIGCASLSRDSIRVFAWFLGAFMIARAAAVDRRRLRAAVTVTIVLLAGEYATRYPIQVWNRLRSGRGTVCQSSDGCIWRYGIWAKHRDYAWYESAGIGFGDYLDPGAGKRVREHFAEHLPDSGWYSFTQFVRVVAEHPLAAIMFKVVRVPVLWLATDLWPRSAIRPQSIWCVAMYAILAALVVVRIRRKQPIPEVLYLYLLLIVCAAPVIHFEFRYTFPIWNTLVLVPALLVETLSRACVTGSAIGLVEGRPQLSLNIGIDSDTQTLEPLAA